MPRFTELITRLPASVPFKAPEAVERGRGRAFAARLGANESAFGPSPRALAAMEAAARRIAWYGDPEAHDLRAALAERLGLRPAEIAVGSGIDDLLGLFVRLTVAPGTPVVTSQGAYPTFNYHVNGFGGRPVAVPYRDDREDLDALLDAVREHDAPLVYLANPDNPMGTWHDAAAIGSFIEALPRDGLLLLDEAYAEFAPADAVPALTPLDPRVVRLRTFSKAYGLAGLRVGYAVAEEGAIRALDKVRNHFGVGRVAQAGALTALSDEDHLAAVIAAVAEGRNAYADLAASMGLNALPSATNFVAIDVGGAGRAQATLERLQERGVFVRMPGVAPLNRCIRVTVGMEAERQLFAEALTDTLRVR